MNGSLGQPLPLLEAKEHGLRPAMARDDRRFALFGLIDDG